LRIKEQKTRLTLQEHDDGGDDDDDDDEEEEEVRHLICAIKLGQLGSRIIPVIAYSV